MNEKVSIIITHYEEPAFLNILIQSIRACSCENEYEIIIANSGPDSEKNKQYLTQIESIKEVTHIVESKESGNLYRALQSGINKSAQDSSYFIFMHSDCVVLNTKWIDFFIETSLEFPKAGAICIGPLMKYTGPDGVEREGPYYNFLFTPREKFFQSGGFQYSDCKNVGIFLGFQHQLQSFNLNVLMASPGSLVHHYGLGKISQDAKIEDIRLFNKKFIEKSKQY